MIAKKMSLLDKAMKVAKEYPVFPCNSRKAPIVPSGFKAATQNPEEVERMFSLPNAAMIGVPTGDVSGISVIDIDVKDGKDGLTWERENASLLGHTLKSKTISGGRHYIYKHRAGVRNSAGLEGCVDVRGDGGYFIHPYSEGYQFLNEGQELADFPLNFPPQKQPFDIELTCPNPLSIERMIEMRDSYNGQGWNNTISTICYSAAERGCSDWQIREFLARICDKGANDPDLIPILRSVRKKVGIQDSGDTNPIPLPKKTRLPLAKLGLINIDEIEPRKLVYGRDYLAGVFR